MIQSREKYVPIQYVPTSLPAGVLTMRSKYLPGGFVDIPPYGLTSILRDAYVDVKPRWGHLLKNLEYSEPVASPVADTPPVSEAIEEVAEEDSEPVAEEVAKPQTHKKSTNKKKSR